MPLFFFLFLAFCLNFTFGANTAHEIRNAPQATYQRWLSVDKARKNKLKPQTRFLAFLADCGLSSFNLPYDEAQMLADILRDKKILGDLPKPAFSSDEWGLVAQSTGLANLPKSGPADKPVLNEWEIEFPAQLDEQLHPVESGKNIVINLEQTFPPMKTLYEFICQSPTGRKLIFSLLPQLRALKIEPFSSKIYLEVKPEHTEISEHPTATYYFLRHILFMNPKGDLGQLTGVVSHEITHVSQTPWWQPTLDQLRTRRRKLNNLYSSITARTGLSPDYDNPSDEMWETIFRTMPTEATVFKRAHEDMLRFKTVRKYISEFEAYNQQEIIQKELMHKFPTYKRYVRFVGFPIGLSRSELLTQYNLNAQFVEDYTSGRYQLKLQEFSDLENFADPDANSVPPLDDGAQDCRSTLRANS